jgi:hypothetical protein
MPVLEVWKFLPGKRPAIDGAQVGVGSDTREHFPPTGLLEAALIVSG